MSHNLIWWVRSFIHPSTPVIFERTLRTFAASLPMRVHLIVTFLVFVANCSVANSGFWQVWTLSDWALPLSTFSILSERILFSFLGMWPIRSPYPSSWNLVLSWSNVVYLWLVYLIVARWQFTVRFISFYRSSSREFCITDQNKPKSF